MILSGKAIVLGDNVNTDLLHPPAFYSTDAAQAASGFLAGLDLNHDELGGPPFVIVAGHNFGCGSSRESTARALQTSGVRGFLAISYAHIFRRTAMNLGMPALLLSTPTTVGPGQMVWTSTQHHEQPEGHHLETLPLDKYWTAILQDGGLTERLKNRNGGW